MLKAYVWSKRDKVIILNDEKLEEKALCECYSKGQKIGCYDAGCYFEGYDGFVEGHEEEHYQVVVYEYHDGHNWQSLIVRNDYNDNVDLVLHEKSDEIIALYLEVKTELKNKLHENPLYAEVETEKYTFADSNYTGSFITVLEK